NKTQTELDTTKKTLAQKDKDLAAAQQAQKASDEARAKALKDLKTEQAAHQTEEVAHQVTKGDLKKADASLNQSNVPLGKKSAELDATIKALADSRAARLQLATDLAGERAQHRFTTDLLAKCFDSLIEFHTDLVDRSQELTKTQGTLKTARQLLTRTAAEIARAKTEIALKSRLLDVAQKSLLQTRVQLNNTRQALEKSETD